MVLVHQESSEEMASATSKNVRVVGAFFLEEPAVTPDLLNHSRTCLGAFLLRPRPVWEEVMLEPRFNFCLANLPKKAQIAVENEVCRHSIQFDRESSCAELVENDTNRSREGACGNRLRRLFSPCGPSALAAV
jgi:hypothetical protein